MARRFPHNWTASPRFAWRDLRASPAHSAFIVAAMAMSTAAISGVGGAADAARDALRANSRQWLAADLSVNTKTWPTEEQTAVLNQMGAAGGAWTIATSTVSMAASDQSPDPVFIAVKAADAAVYPFYGTIGLKPGLPLAQALDSQSAIVSGDVLTRLQVRAGDSIRLGGQAFRIAAAIESEPDRFAGTPGAGMRCILSRAGYIRSGISRAGNSELHRILIRLPQSARLAEVRNRLEDEFPDASVLDYRDANQPAVAAMDLLASALGMTAFVVLALGVGGVAIAVREHVEQRMDTIAVLKAMGARNGQVARMLLLQIGALIACAWVAGIPLAWAIQAAVLSFAGKFLPLEKAAGWNGRALAEGAGASLIAAIPIVALALLAAGGIKPAVLLRRQVEGGLAPGPGKAARLVFCAGCAALALILTRVARLTGSWKSAAGIAAGFAASVFFAWLLSEAALRIPWRRIGAAAAAGRPAIGHALRSLTRSRRDSRIAIMALSMGLMTIAGSYGVDRTIARAVLDDLPFDRANLFVANFDDARSGSLLHFLSGQPGVEGSVEVLTMARFRLRRVNGKLLDDSGRNTDGGAWLVGCTSHARGLTVADDVARTLGLAAGSKVEFTGSRGVWSADVTAIVKMNRIEKVWFSFEAACPLLAGQDLFHHAALRVRPDRVDAVRRSVSENFPTLPVITGAELAETVTGAVDEELTLIRALAWIRMAAGLFVLIAVVSASRGARLHEIGILGTLGATRATLIRYYTAEFAAIGILSGAIGSVLACGFTSVSLGWVFGHAVLAIEWKSITAAMVLAPAVAIGAGWLPTWRLLGRKPLTVLRGE